MDILALLQPIEDTISKTTLRQMSRVILAMLAMTGRVTMLGLSRWAEADGSYQNRNQPVIEFTGYTKNIFGLCLSGAAGRTIYVKPGTF